MAGRSNTVRIVTTTTARPPRPTGIPAPFYFAENLAPISGTAGTFTPAGELARRIALSLDRLTGPGFPAYTPDFVLADVELRPSYERLYQNFSGDISGRYLEALSAPMPERRDRELDPLLPPLLRCQRTDGRFGREDLDFSAATIGAEHMALLWGNGRLLAGLLARHRARHEPAVLDASRRLGDFLLRIRGECSRPEVAKRLEGMGAKGLICFTQLVEPLTLLGQATGDRRYWSEARAIASSLPPRGVQHTHGYPGHAPWYPLCSTRRQAIRPCSELVEDRYDDLLRSPDSLVDGGVLEFFGARRRTSRPRISASSGRSTPRTRRMRAVPRRTWCDWACICGAGPAGGRFSPPPSAACSITSSSTSLPRATSAIAPSSRTAGALRATRHGVVVLHDARISRLRRCPPVDRDARRRGSAGEPVPGRVVVRRCQLASGSRGFPARLREEPPDRFRFHFVHAGPDAQTLSLRQPDWASPLQIRLNGREMNVERKNGFVSLPRIWHAGDELIATVPHIARLETRDGRTLRPEEVGDEPVEAALCYGPYLLAVHEADQPLFFRRPWTFPGKNASMVELPANWDQARLAEPAIEQPREQGPLPGRVPARLPSRRLAEHESGGVPAVELVHNCPAAGGGRGVDSLPPRPQTAASHQPRADVQ